MHFMLLWASPASASRASDSVAKTATRCLQIIIGECLLNSIPQDSDFPVFSPRPAESGRDCVAICISQGEKMTSFRGHLIDMGHCPLSLLLGHGEGAGREGAAVS